MHLLYGLDSIMNAIDTDTITGSCLCGAIRFSLRAPFAKFVHCHCSRCRKSSGAAHSTNLAIEGDRFAWIEGESEVIRYCLPTARRFGKWFCRRCGCPVPRELGISGLMIVPAGLIDTPLATGPTEHIYWGSKAAWGCVAGELPTHTERPPP